MHDRPNSITTHDATDRTARLERKSRIDDNLLEGFAADVIRLEARVADLIDERDRYRELAQQAIHVLHTTNTQRTRDQQTIRELREITAAIAREQAAA